MLWILSALFALSKELSVKSLFSGLPIRGRGLVGGLYVIKVCCSFGSLVFVGCFVSSCERSVQKLDSAACSLSAPGVRCSHPLLPCGQLHVTGALQPKPRHWSLVMLFGPSVPLCSSPWYCLEAGSLTELSPLSARLICLWVFRIRLSLPPFPRCSYRHAWPCPQIWAQVLPAAEQLCFPPLSHFYTFLNIATIWIFHVPWSLFVEGLVHGKSFGSWCPVEGC